MKLQIGLIGLIFSLYTHGQTCTPNIQVSAVYCPNRTDTNRVCPYCYDCTVGLKAIDSNLVIISFKLRGTNLCGDQPEKESDNTGSTFNESRSVIIVACPGSKLEFYCIKARDKNGKIYILQPLKMELH